MGNRIEYGNGIIQNGLILHLDAGNPQSFDGNSTTWYDLSGNGNHASLINGPTYDSGNKGGIQFDGVNDYIYIPKGTILDFHTYGFTLSVWVRFSSLSTTSFVFTSGQSNYQPYQFSLGINNSKLFFHITNSTNTDGLWNGSYKLVSGTLSTGIFYKVDVVRINFSYYLYVNTQLVSVTNTSTIIDFTANRDIYINGVLNTSGTGIQNNFNGLVSNVLFYRGKYLSQQEITQNFNATRLRYGI